MPGVSLVGVDTAGGVITGRRQSRVTVNGHTVAVMGDDVASHAPCPAPASHCAAVMVQGSSRVTIDGIPIVRAGDAASCGHTATGQATHRDE